MRPNLVLALFILCYFSTKLPYIHAFKVARDVALKDSIESGTNIIQDIREKREVESFDSEDYPSAPSQDEKEEPGFWDRMIKVALKLFSKLVEWLNSS